MTGDFLVLGVGIDEGAGWPSVRDETNRVMSALQPWDSGTSYLLMVDEQVDERRGWSTDVRAAPRGGACGGRPRRAVRAATSRP